MDSKSETYQPLRLATIDRASVGQLELTSMHFVFSKLFYILLAVGFVPLSLSWGRPMLRWVALTCDLALIAIAIFDAWISKLPARVRIERHFGGRFAVGAETEVRIEIANHTAREISLIVKDEYPPQMKLSGAREARDLNAD